MRKIKAFIHIAVMRSWKISYDILKEHIQDSGILTTCDEIHYCINGNLSQASHHMGILSSKEKLIHLSEHVDNWEAPTLNYLRESCIQEDLYALYIHTKGASNLINEPRRNGSNSWLDAMAHNTITKHGECLAALDSGYDCSGYGFQTRPFVHYCGNAWWSRSSHIQKLIKLDYDKKVFNFSVEYSHRHDAEKWVCSYPGKFHNIEYQSPNYHKYNRTF